MEPIEVQYPYCGSWFETEVDISARNQDYVEDCAVCCQPIPCAPPIGRPMAAVFPSGRIHGGHGPPYVQSRGNSWGFLNGVEANRE